MATVGRRLEGVESVLTARDRVRLWARATHQGHEADERLDRYCSPWERGELERMMEALRSGVHATFLRLLFEIEWVARNEVLFGWLECLSGFLKEETALRKVAGAAGKRVPVPEVRVDGLVRDLPFFAADSIAPLRPPVIETGGKPPTSRDELLASLVLTLRRGVEDHWRSLEAFQAGIEAASEALGERVEPPILAEAMRAAAEKVLMIHRGLQPYERFELPEATEEDRETALAFWRLEDLREAGSRSDPRASLWGEKREELEEWEREQKASLDARA